MSDQFAASLRLKHAAALLDLAITEIDRGAFLDADFHALLAHAAIEAGRASIADDLRARGNPA